jgi:hypothetical protein
MPDLSIPYLIADFFAADPFRSLGLIGFACVAISITTDFDLLHLLGFVEVGEAQDDHETTAA